MEQIMIKFSMRADMRAAINQARSIDMIESIQEGYQADPIESAAIAESCRIQWAGFPFMRHHRPGLIDSIGSGLPYMIPIESESIEGDSGPLNMLIQFGALISWGEFPD